MASIYCYRLVFLSQIWHVSCAAADATLEVVATCSEDVLLPCKALQDPQITYREVSWYKIGKNGGEWKKLQYIQEPDSRAWNESSEVSNSTGYSLKIKNTTSYSSGTYKCILRTPARKYNQSSTVTLKIIDCPEQLEEEKIKKYKTELVLLCCLGVFYLLLIFFTCTCLKEKRSPDYHKSTKKHIANRSYLISIYSKEDFQGLGWKSPGKDKLNQGFVPGDFVESLEAHQ